MQEAVCKNDLLMKGVEMPDYKQTAINGTSWQRAWRVECENPLNGKREVIFHEEHVLNAGNRQVRTPVGGLRVQLTEDNALTSFQLLDPDTGEAVGTATYAQVYHMLHSFYMHSATQRDAQHLALQEQPDTQVE